MENIQWKQTFTEAQVIEARRKVHIEWQRREGEEDAILEAAAAILARRNESQTSTTSNASADKRHKIKKESQDKFVFSAKDYNSLTTSVRLLPKWTEPERGKAHWDHVLEEVKWVSKEYMRERKWKRGKAKTFSRLVAEKAMRRALMKSFDPSELSFNANSRGAPEDAVEFSISPFAKYSYIHRINEQAQNHQNGDGNINEKNANNLKAGGKRGRGSWTRISSGQESGRAGMSRKALNVGAEKGDIINRRGFQLEMMREVERARRRVWSIASKNVIAFWGKAQRIVEYRIRQKLEKERNVLLNQRLNKLVGQTEKYSKELAVTIGNKDQENGRPIQVTDIGVTNANGKDNININISDGVDEDDYIPTSEDDPDDEQLLLEDDIVAAYENGDLDPKDEAKALLDEANLPIEKLLEMYAKPEFETNIENIKPGKDFEFNGRSMDEIFTEVDGDEDFDVESVEEDERDIALEDEIIAAAENGDLHPKDEAEALAAEANMPIERLLQMYGVEPDHNFDAGKDDKEFVKDEKVQFSESNQSESEMDDIFTDEDEDDDFDIRSAENDNDDDQDATILEEETLAKANNEKVGEELESLEAEAEMPIEQVMKMYGKDNSIGVRGGMPETHPNSIHNLDEIFDDNDEDDEYENFDESEDDEATIREEEERMKFEVMRAGETDELKKLEEEADIPIDELMKKYGAISHRRDCNTQSYSALNDQQVCVGAKSKEISKKEEVTIDYSSDGSEEDIGLNTLYDESISYENRINDISKEALTAQPTGYTLDTTNVKTKVPFLLKYSLREYQHIGLDWLVSMYEKKFNGILADEMGLGKTIMTIALLAWLACEKGMWGPHLIVVPTSVIINWEMELKKWAPGFKLLVYFGSAKERKLKRQGWSKPNAFHVCITTYTLVIQDSKAFRRKRWQYLILDEAHLIKNWRSLRWQTLLNFHSKRRILITGTPLQNDLMELWSLLHFLMPKVFGSHAEFRDLFSNPLTSAVEGTKDLNQALVGRLHGVLRPFLLRRLKSQVEKQLPGKFEHVIKCSMSRRQKRLYEEYMNSIGTKSTLASGNFLGIINVLMQLRKCCNHPDLFAGRAIVSSFDMERIVLHVPSLVVPLFKEFKSEIVMQSGMILVNNELLSTWDVQLWQSARNLSDVGTTNYDSDSKACISRTKYLLEDWQKEVTDREAEWHHSRQIFLNEISKRRCEVGVIYGLNVLRIVYATFCTNGALQGNRTQLFLTSYVKDAILSYVQRAKESIDIITNFTFAIPKARTLTPALVCSKPDTGLVLKAAKVSQWAQSKLSSKVTFLRQSIVRTQMFFPDRRLVQFDCGKLQELAILLRKLMKGGHKVLIFTQMTKMLDVLENFLNLYSYKYLRLDGSTKPDQRMILMQRFNTNPKLFAFILSTRSGGVGINLTGADTVIFYDSDWNPAMDAQAQDRCHRIGQTREVHIYRLVTEDTIEENILKKSNQKRRLDHLAIQAGSFTTDFLSGSQGSLNDILENHSNADVEKALLKVEDADDVIAMKKAKQESEAEMNEFTQETNEKKVLEKNNSESTPYAKPSQIATDFTDPPDKVMDNLSPIEKYAIRFLEQTGMFVLPSFTISKSKQASKESQVVTGKDLDDMNGNVSEDEDEEKAVGLLKAKSWDNVSAKATYFAEVSKVQSIPNKKEMGLIEPSTMVTEEGKAMSTKRKRNESM